MPDRTVRWGVVGLWVGYAALGLATAHLWAVQQRFLALQDEAIALAKQLQVVMGKYDPFLESNCDSQPPYPHTDGGVVYIFTCRSHPQQEADDE